MVNILDQHDSQVKFDWAIGGVQRAVARKDAVVIIDVLSFSSTCLAAVTAGATILPFGLREGAQEYANASGAALLFGRAESKHGRPSLSPLSFCQSYVGTKFVLCSRNGAACTELTLASPLCLIGCMRNAHVTAQTALEFAKVMTRDITLVACGERIDGDAPEGELRPCIEDLICAGAIAYHLQSKLRLSPECTVAVGAYTSCKKNLQDLIMKSISGQELEKRGFIEDVIFSAQLDASDTVVIFNKGEISKYVRSE